MTGGKASAGTRTPSPPMDGKDCWVIPPSVAARLIEEETVVGLFRPVLSSGETLAGPVVGSAANIREGFRHAMEEYVVSSGKCVHTPAVTEKEIQSRFLNSEIPKIPVPVKEYIEHVMPDFLQDSTRVACSRQIGHMTGSLPNYIPPLAELVTAMNQNVVKVETSKTVTLLEKQVMACMHRLIFRNEGAFYDAAIQETESVMGMFTSGGTIANITGLWVARNGALGPDVHRGFAGVEECGMIKAAIHYGFNGAVVIGSALMHYSFKKAADVLGIGVQGLVTVDYDERYRVRVDQVEQKLLECKANNICVIAVVGIAGATETGSVDDLQALSELAQRFGVHFHVDAAWGGPCLFSSRIAPIMAGIERADSVTMDAHKQLFTPMGCGMLILKEPEKCKLVSKTASYIIRAGSNDLGRFTLEGSRPGNAVYMHANLSCIGSRGYALLMDRSVRICRYMASALRSTGVFEVLFEPMTNILLYRYVPPQLRAQILSQKIQSKEQDFETHSGLSDEDWEALDQANRHLQDSQKADGRTFVSRTSVNDLRHGKVLVALRVVIGNPVTEESDIDLVIDDQLRIMGEGRRPCVAEGKDTPKKADIAANTYKKGTPEKIQKDTPTQDEYWRQYWSRMSQAARLFLLDDCSQIQAN